MATLLHPVPAGAADFHRVAPGGGEFTDPQRWSPPGVPGPGDRAIFNLSSDYTVNFRSTFGFPINVTNQRLRIGDDDVTFNLGAPIAGQSTYELSSSISIGGAALFSPPGPVGLLRISGGVLRSPLTVIGDGDPDPPFGFRNFGSGLMEVRSGATFDSTFLLSIGGHTPGTLEITGGHVDTLFADIGVKSTGTATVSGAGSTWQSQELIVGGSTSGTLNVVDGGALTTTSEAIVGLASGVTGTVNVSGQDAVWTHESPFIIGRSGTGLLDISAGGFVETTVSGTTTIIGDSAGASGSVTVDGESSRWSATGGPHDLAVGRAGSGSLTVTAGGLVSFRRTAIGPPPGGGGMVELQGEGSRLNSSNLFVGGDASSAGGPGTLTIGPGAIAISAFGPTRIWGPGVIDLEGGTLRTSQLELEGGEFNWSTGTLQLTGADLFIEPDGLFGDSLALVADMELRFDAPPSPVVRGLFVGDSGTGTLTAADGAAILSGHSVIGGAGGSGTATVDGSTWTTRFTLIVADAGTGQLDVQGGGLVETQHAAIGLEAGSDGTVTINDAGLRIVTDVAGQSTMPIGAAGSGTLNILPGGSVETEWNRVVLGYQPGGDGTVHVTGPDAAWTLGGAADTLTVGRAGTGLLDISAGATVISGAGILAETADSQGTVQVVGRDALDQPSSWRSPFLVVGADGLGQLEVSGGGLVHTTEELMAGTDANGRGEITISGAGSRLLLGIEEPNGSVTYGDIVLGTAELNVIAAGAVEAGGVFIGDGAQGTATVSGPGSKLEAEEVVVAFAGTGTLSVSDNAVVESEVGVLGTQAEDDGTVVVDTGGEWIIEDELFLGDFGRGELTISDGGRVENTVGYIAMEQGSQGTATVDGDDSSWTTGGDLFLSGSDVAPGGTGTINLQGGSAAVGDTLTIWNTGTVNLDGGTLSSETIDHTHGGEFSFDGGTLHVDQFEGDLTNTGGTLAPGRSVGSTTITGNYTQQPAAGLEIEIGGDANCPQADQLTITGSATLAGALNIALIDGCQPELGQSFDVVFYGSRSGEFSPVVGMGIGGGLRFLPVYEPDRLSLEVVPTVEPDLDGDGDVDEQDLALFAACATGPTVPYDPQNLPPGCTLTPDAEGTIAADLDRDGDVDHDDFAILQRCYGGPNVPADPDCAN